MAITPYLPIDLRRIGQEMKNASPSANKPTMEEIMRKEKIEEENKRSIPPANPSTTEEMAGINHNHPTRGETLEEYSKRTRFQPQTIIDHEVFEEVIPRFDKAVGRIIGIANMLALSPAKLQFCQQQKRTYARIYNALKRSNILSTSTQWEMLGSIRAHMKGTTGRPSSHADILMINDLTSLLDLLNREDHLSSKESGSMVINSTIEKQVELLIEELSDLVREESRREQPFRVTHESPLDIATFVTIHLQEIQQRKSNSRRKFMFHSGCKEILRQLTLVFSESNFPFNNHQHRQIEDLCTSIRRFNGDPKTENYEEIKQQVSGVVCSIWQNPPPREVVKTNSTIMTDPNGSVTKAVDYITFGLHGLARTTAEHLLNYNAESRDSPFELITTIVNRFKRIYPPRYTLPQPRAHNINTVDPMDASS